MTESQLFQIRKKQIFDSLSEMFKRGLDAIAPTILVAGCFVVAYLLFIKNRNDSHRKKVGTILLLFYTVFLMEMTIFLRTRVSYYRVKIIPFMTSGGTHLLLLYAFANMVIFMPIGIAFKMIRSETKSYRKVIHFSAIISGVIEVAQFLLKCGVCQTEDFLMNILGAIIGWWFCGRILLKKENDSDKNIDKR